MSHQPLLITGAPGRGQWALAKRTAKSYVCEAATKPCGFCTGCTLFDAGTHPDVWLWNDDGETISIDMARELYDAVHQKPTRAPCRVVLVEHFDRATSAAQQSLLKMVEEPFVPTGIIFTARSALRVIPTMRSRMAILPLKPMTRDAFQAWCKEEGIAYDEWLYDLTDGSPFILKNLDLAKLMQLKSALEQNESIHTWVDAFDRDIFFAAAYHVLALRAKKSLLEKDFERLDAWQSLYQEVGLSKSMNWAMQCKVFYAN